ncbi:cadherin-like beta sandwich domain-containing protein [Tumebacillus sp. ITR2]|uniref:Cadherin-like beta sandwich domain-containing protein n=1 Tax=Tumebacillus amylolyticus TaxID=2801339 RepID=A0ABS1J8G9_9BACL|nr:cadherin-like beta sandwich domain-containing protein [Tumebacillus amylolyticus]MBL0386542.1 cadherin-like beta sandwich domain-containing protein [Tumebacillus amylolyticus]
MRLYRMMKRYRRSWCSFLVFLLMLAASGAGNFAHMAQAVSTWSTQTSNVAADLNGVSYGGGRWVAVGNGGNVVTSTDGVSWSFQTLTISPMAVAYAGGQWVIVGMAGKIYTSSNGTTWTSRTSGVSNDLISVAHDGTRFVVVGAGGTILTSTNGVIWSKATVGAARFNGVTYAGGLFVAVGDGGVIATSPDGTAWTPRTSGTSQILYAVSYAGGKYVSVGDVGTLLTSADGVSWTQRSVPSGTISLYGVTYGGGKFVAVGDSGTILSSSDTISWSAETSGTPKYFNFVAYGGSQLIAVGQSGLIVSQFAPLSTNANLSGLTLSQGTLSPAFASGTTSYSASVANGVSSVVVTATTADATATMTVNGTATASGSGATVPLNVGSNSILVLVTAQDGTTQQPYVVTVTRAAPLSSNANLSTLTLSQGTMSPAFAAGTVSYTASVANAVTSVNVTPTVADGTATLTVNGTAATSGNAVTVPLNVGANTISVLVTAQDGTTQKTYTVTVTRAAALSSNADLSSLALSQGTLSPVFASGTTSYTANVANAVTSVNVTPTVADGTATLKVNGSAATSGNAVTVPLVVGDNTITVQVTAQDGTTQKKYTVTVTRAPSGNADLSNLTLSQGALAPVFASGTTIYTANVANAVTSVDVTPTIADGTATLKVNGSAATSGNAVTLPLVVGDNTITIQVTAQDGTTKKTYTVTVTRAPSGNADLINLTLSQGALAPVFASGTTTYTANVANAVTSVDVTPTIADGTATLKVNGSAATSGNAVTVPLVVGDNTITVQVTAQDGTTQKTYTVTVTRAPSSNADLSNLTLSQGTLAPVFASGTTTYTANVANAVTSVDVTPTIADGTATLKVNGSAATSGNAVTVPLVVGDNTITVQVTAQDGTTQKTYTVTVIRAPSSNADLSNLTLSQGTLAPVFASGTTTYTASVANAVTSVDVTPTVADGTATLKVNGSAVASGNAVTLPLLVGDNTITVQVTAQDGTTKKTYTVTVTRAPSSNADLSNLTLSQGTLAPVFASGTTIYTANVANTVTNVDVTPTIADGTATLKVNGTDAISGNAVTLPLLVGDNTITVQVTAQDGTTQKTYIVTVTRAPSSNADLSNLTLSQGTLAPVFASGTTTYTANVANAVTSVDVTPTIADGTATLKVNGTDATSGNAVTLPLVVGDNTITIQVTAQDGTTQKTYTVTVTRAPSSNADLSNLTLSQGTLAPLFASGTTTYTASVANAVTSVDVTPTIADGTATLKVNGTDATSGNAVTLPLLVGDNTITVQVTAQDGTTQKTYTVTVTRAPSSNADLSNLTLSQGTLAPVFASGTTTYTASVANAVTSVDVTPTIADGTATLKVNGTDATSGNAVTLPLLVGDNTITVQVTAQDGTTQKTYTVTVTRAPSSNADLSNLTLSQGTLAPVFASGTTTYTASVANAVTSVDVTPTIADGTATLKVNGTDATSGNAVTLPLVVGDNTITIQVTAQDGTTQKTYTVTVTRAPSSNADLSNLTLSQGTLTPVFASGTTTYSASVGNAVTNLDVTPTIADGTATLKVNGTNATSGNAVTLPLLVGDNTITIQVTAQDGTTQKTYTVTITRAPSSNADLGNLTLNKGTILPTFTPGTTTYATSVSYRTISLDLTPTTADNTATLKLNGTAVTSGTAQRIYLQEGLNTFTIQVTAQDNTTQKTYTLAITRNAPPTPTDNTIVGPYGVVRDAITQQTLNNVKLTLYWADTALNQLYGRTPGTQVVLNQPNTNPQFTQDDGTYSFKVISQADYYFIAERDGYETYDSRSQLLHIDQTAVERNIQLTPKSTNQGEHSPYIYGYQDGTFHPDQSITRAELAAILARILHYEATSPQQTPFRDVSTSSWAAGSIAAVSQHKIMIGSPDGNFYPDQAVTRAEIAVVLSKLRYAPPGVRTMLTDITGHWARDYILQAYSAGLVSGYPDGTYRPEQMLTRAETVVIFNKLLDRKPSYVAETPRWKDVPPTFWAYADIMEASVFHSYLILTNGLEVWKP